MSSLRPVVLCLPGGAPPEDPGPDETARRNVELLERLDERPVGVVGWAGGGLDALRLAVRRPDLVERLVLVATPFPEDESGLDLDAVGAKTLLLFGTADPLTGSRHGRAWQRRLPNARLELWPGGGHDLLGPCWGRVLAHLAPRTRA